MARAGSNCGSASGKAGRRAGIVCVQHSLTEFRRQAATLALQLMLRETLAPSQVTNMNRELRSFCYLIGLYSIIWFLTGMVRLWPWLIFDPFGFQFLEARSIILGLYVSGITLAGATSGVMLFRVVRPLKGYALTNIPRLALDLGAFAVFLLIFFHLLISFTEAASRGFGFSIKERSFLSKTSIFEILLLSSCYLNLVRHRGLGPVLTFGIQCFAVLYVLLDVTREALIPSALALYYSFSNRQGRTLSATAFVFILSYSMFGRTGLDLSELTMGRFFQSIGDAIGYVTVMNTLHLSDVLNQVETTGFSFSMFLQSISPLPGSWVGSANLELRNIDAVRPFGAVSDLYLLNPTLLFLVFLYFGAVWAAALNAKHKNLQIVLVGMLIIAFSQLHQYHLRSAMKFIYAPHILYIAYIMVGRSARAFERHDLANPTKVRDRCP